ncbi:MAG TPA: ABC transporter permease, partial [Candidatus Acidoferrales bacterium]
MNTTANFFDVMRPRMILGRGFLPEEEQQGSHRVVVLSEMFWRRQFAADPKIINKKIRLDSEEYTVVGVSERTEPRADLYVPISYSPAGWANRGSRYLFVIGRLKSGVSPETADEHLDAIATGLETQFPNTNTGRRVLTVPLHEQITGRVRTTLMVLLGAVGFVLLIACTNVANLLLARATSRERETAIRAALGAGRARLMRQFLTEALILFLAGGAAGLLLAMWGVDALTALAANYLPMREQVQLDNTVLGFTLGISILTGMIFSLFPALQISRTSVQSALQERGSAAASGGRNRARAALVVVEVAAAFVLLIGATLMVRSFLLVRDVDPGFRAQNLLTMRISLPSAKYPGAAGMRQFYSRALERISALPGVESAGLITYLPIQEWGINAGVEVEGQDPLPADEAPVVEYRLVSAGYLRTMDIPVVEGRGLTEQDAGDAPAVVLINQTLAKKLWGQESPVGWRIRFGGEGNPWATIAGVAADVKQAGLTNTTRPEMYIPYNHAQVGWISQLASMTLVVRTPGDPRQLANALQREIHAVDPEQAVYSVRTMEEVIALSITDRQLSMTLLGTFAGLATLLAAIGVFGVMAYSVAQRTHEIGVRMALGAQRSDVLRMILQQGLVLAAMGVAAGIGAAFGLTRFLQTMLFDLKPNDPLTFAAISVVVLLVTLVACWLPARRATRTDPMVALRYQ